MSANMFQGTRVRLAAQDAEADPALIAPWTRRSDFMRQIDSDPAQPMSPRLAKEEIEHRAGRERAFGFALRTVGGDQMIGFAGLVVTQWAHGEALAFIAVGDPDYQGRGYGTEAMRLLLRYAFDELNLNRVGLQVFADNPRAVRSYAKAGFVREGAERASVGRDGQRVDSYWMGVVRADWERGAEGNRGI